MTRAVPVLLLMMTVPAVAQHGSSTTVNPYVTPEHAAEGARVYRGSCAGCHGPDGAGTGAGPAINTGNLRRGSSDEAVFQTITKGVPGTAMPAFSLGGLQTWQVVTFLRTLSAAGNRASVHPVGDPDAGAKTFRASCGGCHIAASEGQGLSGPDLTDVAATLSAAQIQEAIMKPGLVVAPEYWSFRFRTADGTRLQGIRLNEDTHSIQIRERSGRLRSFLRTEVNEVEMVRTSPMPPFEGRLSPADLNNLVAFLVRASRAEGGVK